MSKTSTLPTAVDPKTMRNLTRAALRANGRVDVTKRQARIASAVATAVAIRDGYFPGGKNPLWNTQAEYATDLGVSGGTITALKRLGRVLTLGMEPEGAHAEQWSILSDKAGTKFVGDVLDADDLTLAKALAVADAVKAGKDKGTRAAQPNSDGGKGKGDGDDKVTTSTLKPMEQVTVAMNVIAENVAHLSDDDLGAVIDRFNAITGKELQIRAHDKAAKAKPRAPRRTKAA